MSRTCARPRCSEDASATLTYAYDECTVWLDSLSSEDHPMTHDMCDVHAESLSVPLGWDLSDRRSAREDEFTSTRLLEEQMAGLEPVQGNLLSA